MKDESGRRSAKHFAAIQPAEVFQFGLAVIDNPA
jgi:hypothetical protein